MIRSFAPRLDCGFSVLALACLMGPLLMGVASTLAAGL